MSLDAARNSACATDASSGQECMTEEALIERVLAHADTPLALPTKLTQAQQAAADCLLDALPNAAVLVLRANAGAGKTTILRYLRGRTGGVIVGMRDFVEALMVRRPDSIEQAFVEIVQTAMANHEVAILDDFHLIAAIAEHYNYTRGGVLDAAVDAVVAECAAADCKLILATGKGNGLWAIDCRAFRCDLADFSAGDYADLCHTFLEGRIAARLDYARIHRFAPGLNAHQIQNACLWNTRRQELTTDTFIEYLTWVHITSNVEIEEVEPVTWSELKGIEDVIEALEAKIVLPFEKPELAAELALKPKRGVLLAGPPGTGKTTIGRALAHRLKGKFFLIDGTVVADENNFYVILRSIFERAKRNAPSVIFIDDADLLFENGSKGFYRYLLTMLDGLESASAEKVCVMMTAMEVSSIPAALLRSGRVELWLETRLPDTEARAAILRARLSGLAAPVGGADIPLLAGASRGLTGADLKAVVEDGKLLFARDKATGKSERPIDEYFLEAIGTVRANRRSYAKRKGVQLTEAAPFGFAG